MAAALGSLFDRRPSLEEEALLSNQDEKSDFPNPSSRLQRQSRTREWGILIWAILSTFVSVILVALYLDPTPGFLLQPFHLRGSRKDGPKRNIVFMVSDGMGPTSLTMTRNYVQHFTSKPSDPFGTTHPLGIDTHLIGTSRTRSTSSYVTDSAAGATAFSCGFKTYNGAISVLDGGEPCGTVLEAAKLDGYLTGLVVTTDITDATPATFAAHVPSRAQQDRIASHLLGDGHPLGSTVDLMLGGGACRFLPNTSHFSCRGDDTDLFAYARDQVGFTILKDAEGLRAMTKPAPLPLLGLFAPSDIPYEIDRLHQTNKYPSLAEMATAALKSLSAATADSDRGFFLMIEGSRIDHAGHNNDPGAQVREVLAYNEAMAAVIDFIDSSDVPTVLVSTSDHETGGLASARQVDPVYAEYYWNPEVLAKATHSTSFTAAQIKDAASSGESSEEIRDSIQSFLSSSLGIDDPTENELDLIVDSALSPPPSKAVTWVLSEMISRRAHIGWSTHGHSALDVNIYGYPRDKVGDLFGNHENVEIGHFLARYLDVNVDAVTKRLREKEFSDKKDLDGVPLWMSGGIGQVIDNRKRDLGDSHDAWGHYH